MTEGFGQPVAFRRWNAEWAVYDYATPEGDEDFTGWEPLYARV